MLQIGQLLNDFHVHLLKLAFTALPRYDKLHVHTQLMNYACQKMIIKKQVDEIFYYLMEVQNDCKTELHIPLYSSNG